MINNQLEFLKEKLSATDSEIRNIFGIYLNDNKTLDQFSDLIRFIDSNYLGFEFKDFFAYERVILDERDYEDGDTSISTFMLYYYDFLKKDDYHLLQLIIVNYLIGNSYHQIYLNVRKFLA